jgi:hypothetical protein
MRKFTVVCSLLFITLSLGHKALAQDVSNRLEASKAPAHYYHIDFVFQELGADGKPFNSRSYSCTVSTDPRGDSGSVRTGSRVPIITDAKPGTPGSDRPLIQYQYIDVGVNISASGAHEVGDQLAMNVSAAENSLAPPAPGQGELTDPVIRQNLWDAVVLIPIGKPTVVFTSDSLENKGGMQVVVTATPLQ